MSVFVAYLFLVKPFSVKIGNQIKVILIDEIECFYSENKGTYMHTIDNRDYLLDISLEQLESELNPESFYRISRKFIIPLQSIKEIQVHTNSRLKVILPTYKEDEVIVAREKVSDFKKLMDTNHQLCFNVINLVGEKLRKAESRIESLIFKDARARIIDFLKDSVEKRGRRVGFEMLVKNTLTQQDIANITGTSRQTVTSVLNNLRKSDLIYFNRKSILIRDMQKLV